MFNSLGVAKGYGDDMGRNYYFSRVFTQKLKMWCEENDATQQDFCSKVGVTKNMITRYKKGEAYPTVEVLKTICSVFECAVDEFIPIVTKQKTLADFTTKELLAEIERRCGE